MTCACIACPSTVSLVLQSGVPLESKPARLATMPLLQHKIVINAPSSLIFCCGSGYVPHNVAATALDTVT